MIRSRTRSSSGAASAPSSRARASSSRSPVTSSSGSPASSARLAGREHQPDRICPQPPGDEPQGLRRGLVEPLLVVDQADQRMFAGRPGHQAEHGQAYEEPVRRRPRGQAERGPQRVALWRRQLLRPIQQRRAQLMQPGEGQLHLRLHAHRAHHLAPRLPARPARYSSSTVLPTPGSPRTAKAWLCPARTASASRSRALRSVMRSVSSAPWSRRSSPRGAWTLTWPPGRSRSGQLKPERPVNTSKLRIPRRDCGRAARQWRRPGPGRRHRWDAQ